MALAFLRQKRIPLRIRKKVGRHFVTPPGHNYEIDMYGQTYHGTTGSHMDNKIFLYGMHEPSTINLMRSILQKQRLQRKKAVYMDIGTNVGMHLIALADLYSVGYGFEPWQPVRERALDQIHKNKLEHVKVFDFGLSNENGECSFIPPQDNNYGVGAFDTSANQDPDALKLKIRVGDDIVDEYAIEPTLMKLDVEGHEKLALTGLVNTIQKYKPVVVFEYSTESRADLGDKEVLHQLFGKDYHFYGIKRSREFPKLVPFVPEDKYENVLATPYIFKS